MGLVPILMQAWCIHSDVQHWQTMVFTVLCLAQIGHALAVRSDRESLFALGFRSNLALSLAAALALLLQSVIVYVPALQTVFRTQALSGMEVMIVLLCSSIVFISVEIEKWFVRRHSKSAVR